MTLEFLAFLFVASLWVCILAVGGFIGWLAWRLYRWLSDRSFKAAERRLHSTRSL